MINVTRIGSTANLLFGAWLMLSAIVWRHLPPHAVNALVVGALAVAVALVSRRRPYVEAGNVVLAAWLIASLFVLPAGSASLTAHHLLLATLVFGFAAPVLARPELDDLTPRRARP